MISDPLDRSNTDRLRSSRKVEKTGKNHNIPTAKKMREIAEKTKKKADSEAEQARKKYRKKLVGKAQELFPNTLAKVLQEIEKYAKFGYRVYVMDVFVYDYNEHELMVHEMVAKELAAKKYGYRVEGPSREEGYNGEGNNSHDFYTTYRWEVRW
jgi:hypothetical protein